MYRIIGADGREYGPISADQVRQWIAENRANATTRVLSEGSTEWKTLGLLPEFSLLFAQTGAIPVFTTATSVPRTNSFATAGLVFGILSFFSLPFSVLCCCFGPLFNFLGIIFSVIGLAQIQRHPGLYNGKSLAVAGLILSLFCLAVYLVLMAIAVLSSQWQSGISHHAYRL